MSQSNIQAVGVVGAGQMGAGIAQVCATHGFQVYLHDVESEALKRAQQGIEKSLGKLVAKGKIDADASSQALEALHFSSDLKTLAACQLVVEAVTENESLKKSVFEKLDTLCPKETIFASNTSTIPIGRLSRATKRADRFIGMHFMNPVPLMNLVEVIRGFHTSDETVDRIKEVTERLGKAVVCSKDFPGFIVNRVLMPMINEAFFALYEGVASAEEIDLAMQKGTNHPMGPLALADLIGLDTCLFIMEVIHEGLGDSKYRPCPLLRQYVEAGLFGRKSARGVYIYS